MSERFSAVLVRNTALALVLGAVFLVLLPRSGGLGWDFVDAATLGLCFALIGYGAERALRTIPGIDTAGGRAIRVLGWFAAGLWALLLGRVLWRFFGREADDLPALVWGGVFMVGLELALHAALATRGRSDVFRRTPA